MIALIFLEPITVRDIKKIFWYNIAANQLDNIRIVIVQPQQITMAYWLYDNTSVSWATIYCKARAINYITLKVSSSSG